MTLQFKKEKFATQMVDLADRTLQIAQQWDELNASYSVNGFQSGGAHQFVDGDFGNANQQLSAAIVADTMFAIGTLSANANQGLRNSLREAIEGGLP